MKTRVGRILQALSILMVAATLFLWCRGLFRQDKLQLNFAGRTLILASHPYHIGLTLSPPGFTSRRSIEWQAGPPVPAKLPYMQMRTYFSASETSIWVPHWLTILILSIPVLHNLLGIRARRRFAAGLCRNCGYDLRASQDRCPECGAAASLSMGVRQ